MPKIQISPRQIQIESGELQFLSKMFSLTQILHVNSVVGQESVVPTLAGTVAIAQTLVLCICTMWTNVAQHCSWLEFFVAFCDKMSAQSCTVPMSVSSLCPPHSKFGNFHVANATKECT